MNLHLAILVKTIIFVKFSLPIRILNKEIQLPDYDYHRNIDELKTDIRERFLKSKSEMKLLNKLSSNTVYFEGIAHHKVDKDHYLWSKVNAVTEDLRRILAAVDVEYTYKRDQFWRTWRRVTFPDGVKVICYKCNGFVNETCKECNSAGFWNIEENSPCPFEVYSMINKYQMCAATVTQPFDYKEPCPTIIKFPDLTGTCNNPITTAYRITRILGSPVRHSSICKHKNYCEVSTYYRIYKDFIAFKLMDTNNNVLYSKIMKPSNRNYYCVVDCGRFDLTTGHSIDDKPLSISLFSSHINKRDNDYNNVNNPKLVRDVKVQYEPQPNTNVTVTVSPCTKLSRQVTTEDYNENYAYQDYEHKFL